ncbi:hypothetical protein GCM10027176_18670 [Actinoallomurus bryophytorum]
MGGQPLKCDRHNWESSGTAGPVTCPSERTITVTNGDDTKKVQISDSAGQRRSAAPAPQADSVGDQGAHGHSQIARHRPAGSSTFRPWGLARFALGGKEVKGDDPTRELRAGREVIELTVTVRRVGMTGQAVRIGRIESTRSPRVWPNR